MKKEYWKRFFCFCLGAIIFSCISVYAVEYLSAKEISFTPNDSYWDVSNVEEAINSLYEGGGASYDIHGMKLVFDKDVNVVKHIYQEKEIFPIYWYGYYVLHEADPLTSWYESNTRTSFSYQKESVIVNRTLSSGSSQCVGGFTTPYKINLGKYQSFHVLVNNSNLTKARMHFVSRTGSVGSDTSNEANWLFYFPETVSEPTEFIADISNRSGWYYLAISSFCRAGTMDIAAIWLE